MNAADEEDTPWLRDEVDDDDVLSLFTDDAEDLKLAVRHVLGRARSDEALESALIDTLDTSFEQSSDDSWASLWIVVILGEIRSERAIHVLFRGLSSEVDESLQDAAAIALLRIGRPAVLALMDLIDEDPGVELSRAGYRILAEAAVVDDEALVDHVREFVGGRLHAEVRKSPVESAFDAAVDANARLGNRERLPVLKEILARNFGGHHPVLQDAVEMLEENEQGVAFVPTILPWEERYGWLFDDDRDQARVERPPGTGGMDVEVSVPGADALDLADDGESSGDRGEGDDDEADLSRLYWGLLTTAESAGRPLDARRFLRKPAADDEDEESGAN